MSSNARAPNGETLCAVFESAPDIRKVFESGISPSSAVVLFDSRLGRGFFHPTTRSRHESGKLMPEWACGAQWGVLVGQKISTGTFQGRRAATCARQIRADFRRKFSAQLQGGQYPWGAPRKGEKVAQDVSFDTNLHGLIQALNSGPDLRRAIAHTGHEMELPPNFRISWLRVAPEPIECDTTQLNAILEAFRLFEGACSALTREYEYVREFLLAGVDFPQGTLLAEAYAVSNTDWFSVRRPDLHWNGARFSASENDEMPGGFAEAFHVDTAYGLNAARWEECFRYLTSAGPLLIVVSHEWSEVYIPELAWLVETLAKQGYPVHLVTTDKMDDVRIHQDGVSLGNIKIGTVWRQFPIFETEGKLEELVMASHLGTVRMVPEFCSLGNKAWFSMYWKYKHLFEKHIPRSVLEMLDDILPDSTLVVSRDSFPVVVAGHAIENLDALRRLPHEIRDSLVLKVCGANVLAARSLGVLMGHGLRDDVWQQWIDERIKHAQPFIVQSRFETAVAQLPVVHAKANRPEMFNCRLLIRPWQVGGKLVSVACVAVPSNTLRVHGMVDMAVVPVKLM